MILLQTPNIRLTKRETQIMNLMARGRTYDEIALELNIGVETIKTHVFNIKIRFEARNLQQIVAISVQNGLISV